MLWGRKYTEEDRIESRLDPGEKIHVSATQSRFKPGGAALINPNTIFCTDKRVIIRNPVRAGLGENIEEYYYQDITNIRLEKGLLSASVVLFTRGMTEISKQDRASVIWGRDVNGTIDAIPKADAEEVYRFIRAKIQEVVPDKQTDTTIAKLKDRLAKGEITTDEYDKIKAKIDDSPSRSEFPGYG